LEHPDIDVNVKNFEGNTPLLFCCECANVSVVEVLLKDSRVDVTLDDDMGCTPLWWPSRNGHHEVIERLIASGRDLGDIKNKKGKTGITNTTQPLKLQERITEQRLCC